MKVTVTVQFHNSTEPDLTIEEVETERGIVDTVLMFKGDWENQIQKFLS